MNENKYLLAINGKQYGPFKALGDGTFRLMKSSGTLKQTNRKDLLGTDGQQATVLDPNGSELVQGEILRVTSRDLDFFVTLSTAS